MKSLRSLDGPVMVHYCVYKIAGIDQTDRGIFATSICYWAISWLVLSDAVSLGHPFG